MDQQKLRSLVFEKTGVRVDTDDPIFALVALNEAVLAETVERHLALIDSASRELAAHARAAGGLAPRPLAAIAATGADETAAVFGEAAAPETAVAAAPVSAAHHSAAPHLDTRRLLAAAAGIAILSSLIILAGQALFFKPVAPPAPILQALALTPEQQAALANADKLSKAIQKLDPKTRAQLQAELQK